MKKIILTILIGATLSSCTTTKYRKIHVPLELQENCIFEKFTEEEKESMTENVGKKIFRNQENCRIKLRETNTNIEIHNELHEAKK